MSKGRVPLHDEQKQKDIQSDLERQFNKKALPHMGTSQSKPINLGGKNYSVVGQYGFKSPIITYFDVYNESGIRANEKNGQKVFKYISMLQIAERLSHHDYFVNNVQDIEDIDMPFQMKELLKQSKDQSVLELFQYDSTVREGQETLQAATERIAEIEQWTEDHLETFHQAWVHFWDAYDARLKQLFVWRDMIVQHKLTQSIKGTILESIYEEADFMFQLFASSIPVSDVLITDIDDILTLNYELGRAQQQELKEKILTKFELVSNTLFKQISRLLLWVFLPISIILTLLGIESMRFPITAAFFVLLAFYVYTVDVNGMRANIASRLKAWRRDQLSEQPIIQAHYEQALASLQAQQELEQDHEQIDTFHTILARPVRWLIGTGIVILILGWALISADEDSSKYAPGYFAVGGSLIVFGVLLPYWSIGKREFQLAHDKLIIGKREHQTDKIIYIEMKRKGKIVKVLTTHVQQPMLFKVRKEEREAAFDLLKHWCAVYDVRFDES